MATIKSEVQTATALTVTGLSTLASATYCVSNTITLSTNDPLEVLVDVTVTPGTTTGNKQLVVFAQSSVDGTNFSTGPTSGTTTTDEAVLFYVGSLPLNTNATAQRKMFALAPAFGGTLPAAAKIVFKNDSGAAFTAGSVQIAEVWGVSV
jgi:hypothetical protein